MGKGESLVFIYMTAANAAEAEKISQTLVESRLAACVNVLGPVQSKYWWEGKVQSETEVALIAKTTRERVDELVASVKSIHSYSNPCIVAFPIVGGNPDFLKWIEGETRGNVS